VLWQDTNSLEELAASIFTNTMQHHNSEDLNLDNLAS
jgi:hypothetical protein